MYFNPQVAFSEHAAAELRAAQGGLDTAVDALKTMVTFFGEKWDNSKPQGLFSIVARFLVMFDKTVAETLRVKAKEEAEKKKKQMALQRKGRRATAGAFLERKPRRSAHVRR